MRITFLFLLLYYFIMINSNNSFKNQYNIKKIERQNRLDQSNLSSNIDTLKNLIIKPEIIDKKNNIDFTKILPITQKKFDNEVSEAFKKRTNLPYKGIIKDFDYTKIREKHSEDLIVHKVSNKDKLHFNDDKNKYEKTISKQNEDLNKTYAKDKINEHKKQFEYQHKYKYRNKLDSNSSNSNNDIRTDRIEFYKKEQQKNDDAKRKIDDILLNLIDSGVISENLDSINYDKIDINELEKKLKQEFGEDEFNKLMNDINK